MPKNNGIKKVLMIGSGPIIIGQAAEFDYAGTQACRALKEEGIEVVLVNSNPATIMTDTNIADKVYIEPMTVETLKNIIIKEKPDSLLPTLGGQTGLNLAMELSEDGFLEKVGVRLLGTPTEAIKMAEDRYEFKALMERIGEPCIPSLVVERVDDAVSFANSLGYPVIIRPAYTMGGTGGGIAPDENSLREIADSGIRASRVGQILVEKCIAGWKEIEYEVMRDSKGNVITVCNMENIDPVGVHTGDSIVVAPSQTLSDKEYQMLRSSALKIISQLGIEGGCNVQYALNPKSFEYGVIEVNPRVSRSSALASKATGYPIAKVSTKIAIGYGLDEILNAVTKKTYACFEPTLDYVVLKIPKWPFDKFVKAKRTLGTQMKATGEVMAMSNSFEGAFMKALRSLELGILTLEDGWKNQRNHFGDLAKKEPEEPSPCFMGQSTCPLVPQQKWDNVPVPMSHMSHTCLDELRQKLHNIDDERILVVAESLRRGISIDEIHEITQIDTFFLGKFQNIVQIEEMLKKMKLEDLDEVFFRKIKTMGFTDQVIAKNMGVSHKELTKRRKELKITASFKMVDTCGAEFDSETPYYYSTYDKVCEVVPSKNKKVLVLGSGPIRIGQGIEFDYCSVHCVWALKEEGYETIIVNNNPETVSTDFDTADKLYFEPLTPEDVENIVDVEGVSGAVVQFGGQTAIKLTKALQQMGVPIFGTSPEDIDRAEDRKKFDEVLEEIGVPRPEGFTVFTLKEALEAANNLGYPVLVRPSYVLGGQGMEIAYHDRDVEEFMEIITRKEQEHPILIDKYLSGREIEVDAICDGEDILIPGIMEHVERAGVHSGDSISVYPSYSISKSSKEKIVEYTRKLAESLKVKGLMNIQYVLYNNKVYVIEVNPRSSRTVPYISKVTGIPMINIATKVIMGKKLSDFPYGTGLYKEADIVAVKVPVFSFEKLHNVDIGLGPEMKSTGEVLGIGKNLDDAMFKGFVGSNLKIPKAGTGILFTVRDSDKQDIVEIAQGFEELGYKLYATGKTAHYLNGMGVGTNVVRKVDAESPNIIDLIQKGEIKLIINTPTRGRQPERDGFKIRRKAVEMSIPCLTSLDTAQVLLRCMKAGKKIEAMDVLEIRE
jgi:carbamoyl-phosphate synthase large subunit